MINWQAIMQSWDTQQTAYLPYREDRFSIMLDVLEHTFNNAAFTALDLACGPGSISGRVLERFPNAHCIAADLDPILMEIGQHYWADHPRLTWLDINLSHPNWSVGQSDTPFAYLQSQTIDAILTTTALHWLTPPDLTRVYLQLGELQEPGALVMNGDHMMFSPHMTTFRRISEQVKAQQHQHAFNIEKQVDYSQWWANLESELRAHDPAYYEERFSERTTRFATCQRQFSEPIRGVHQALLHNAGYTEVAPIWQRFDNCVLLAIKGESTAPVKN